MPAFRLMAVRLAVLAVILAVGATAGWYAFVREAPLTPAKAPPADEAPDPRITFPTTFRNVRPEVRYVGDAACAGCHAAIDKSYHAHPMGRSAALVADAEPIERYDAAAQNPCTVGPYELWAERTGGKVRHHVRAREASAAALPDYVTTADVAIGSGTRGRSYLSIEEGSVWQTPISWYGPEARWDLSPGFDLGGGGRRGIIPECLFCHLNQAEAVPRAMNRYRSLSPGGQLSIGCERCHGPGELHVAERGAGVAVAGPDTAIVNPKHLSPDLRAGICAQCHLQGEQRVARRGRDLSEFRPGLPLEQFVTIYVRHPNLSDLHRSVGQFEQLQASRCFTESQGALGCTTCHDPHASPVPAARDRFYSDRCLTCHASVSKGCSEQAEARKSKSDLCVTCHMPRAGSSNVVHTSITDHRIRRRVSPAARARGLDPGQIPVVPFPIGPHVPSPAEQERDLGVALSRLIPHIPPEDLNARAIVASLAEERLAAAVENWGKDVPAWLGLCRAREVRRDLDGGFEAASTAAALAPESGEALSNLASVALAIGKLDVAVAAATEVMRLSPRDVDPLLLRASIFLAVGDWARAQADCRTAIEIHPLHPRAHVLLAVCRYRLGDPGGGRQEAETAAALATKPEQRAGLQNFYRSRTR